MINMFLYCSYNGSAVGYRQAVVDMEAHNVRRERNGEIPSVVDVIWTHGGARAAAGCDKDGVEYFLAKRIEYQNEKKDRDEAGHMVYINCAFTGTKKGELRTFANGFLACFQEAVQSLGNLIVTVDDGNIGYTIQDYDGLELLLSSCMEAGRVAKAVIRNIDRLVSFVALEADWDYFVKQNRIPGLEKKPYQCIREQKYLEITRSSGPLPNSAQKPDVEAEMPMSLQEKEKLPEKELVQEKEEKGANRKESSKQEKTPDKKESFKQEKEADRKENFKQEKEADRKETPMQKEEPDWKEMLIEEVRRQEKDFAHFLEEQREIKKTIGNMEMEIRRHSLWVKAVVLISVLAVIFCIIDLFM